MSAAAHAVTLDARCTSPFLTVDNRHASGGITADCGRRTKTLSVGESEGEAKAGKIEVNIGKIDEACRSMHRVAGQ